VDYMEGRTVREEYGRYGNPTQRAAEQKLAALEGAEACLLTGSGMAAISGALLSMLSSGAHVVATSDSHRRTGQLLMRVLPRYGVTASIVPPADYGALEAAMTPKTRAIVSESPTNPYLNVLDIARVVEIGRRHGAKVILDTTLATPYNLRPLSLG